MSSSSQLHFHNVKIMSVDMNLKQERSRIFHVDGPYTIPNKNLSRGLVPHYPKQESFPWNGPKQRSSRGLVPHYLNYHPHYIKYHTKRNSLT